MEINKYKEDYPFFKNNPDIIFFDNASTALKPKCVIEAVNHYYNDLCVNAHRGDYYLSYKVDVKSLCEKEKLTIEEGAREARYRIFKSLIKPLIERILLLN